MMPAPQDVMESASRASEPRAPVRLGPRPLALHTGTSFFTWSSAVMAALPGPAGAALWHPSLAQERARLEGETAFAEQPALQFAVAEAAGRRLKDFLDGLSAYQHHPFRRPEHQGRKVAEAGATRVLAYSDSGPPVLLVPSLVNPATILDLLPERSFVRSLAGRGYQPLVVNWGEPSNAEAGMGLGAYIGRLAGLIQEIAADGAVPVIGYCMGGNLALAASLIARDSVSALGLLATPWNFHADPAPMSAHFLESLTAFESFDGIARTVPIEVFQVFFASLDPALTDRKFRRFASLDPESDEARMFVAVEDWANSGAPVTLQVAIDCLADWYIGNRPARGTWAVEGETIDPGQFSAPTLVAVPRRDRIVPPDSALALAEALPEPTLLRPPSGHVGMMVSSAAERGLYGPVADWLDDVSRKR